MRFLFIQVLFKTVEIESGLPEKLRSQFSTFKVPNQVKGPQESESIFERTFLLKNELFLKMYGLFIGMDEIE
jgi:hypothetical protein